MRAKREEIIEVKFSKCAIGGSIEVESASQVDRLVGNRAAGTEHLRGPEHAATDIEDIGICIRVIRQIVVAAIDLSPDIRTQTKGTLTVDAPGVPGRAIGIKVAILAADGPGKAHWGRCVRGGQWQGGKNKDARRTQQTLSLQHRMLLLIEGFRLKWPLGTGQDKASRLRGTSGQNIRPGETIVLSTVRDRGCFPTTVPRSREALALRSPSTTRRFAPPVLSFVARPSFLTV